MAFILHPEPVELCKTPSQQPVPLCQLCELCSFSLRNNSGSYILVIEPKFVGVFFFFLSFFFGLINYCKHEVLGHCKVPGKCCQSILWKHYTSLFIHHCEPKCLLLCILAHTGYDHVKFANLKGKHALYLDFHFDSY